jgi:hypothetical protein
MTLQFAKVILLLGNHAVDDILGLYREREGGFFSISPTVAFLMNPDFVPIISYFANTCNPFKDYFDMTGNFNR